MNLPQKRYFFLALLLLSSAAHLSMCWNDLEDNYGILSRDDRTLEQTQKTPMLESPPGEVPHWESFNQWLCFPTNSLKLGCFDEETDENGETSDPEKREDRGYFTVMHLDHAGMLYRFESAEWTTPEKCNEEAARLKELIKDREGICVFAAYLPTLEHPEPSPSEEEQTWVYYGVKTRSGSLLAPIFDEKAETELPGDDIDHSDDNPANFR